MMKTRWRRARVMRVSNMVAGPQRELLASSADSSRAPTLTTFSPALRPAHT
jgi:hypothetical protein